MGIGLMDHYIFNSLGPRNSKVPAGEETVIQEGNGCPRSQRSKWQSQHSNPGSLLPKSRLIFFSPAAEIPCSWSTYKSCPSALDTEIVSLPNPGPKERL